MYGVDRWLGCRRRNLVGDPEVLDVVGDEGSGMFDGESKGAAAPSFVDLAPPLCCCCCCMRLDIADLRYDGDSPGWA
jgi:hypothetical protein